MEKNNTIEELFKGHSGENPHKEVGWGEGCYVEKWIEVEYSKEDTDTTRYVEAFGNIEEAENFVSELLETSECDKAIKIIECKTLKTYSKE